MLREEENRLCVLVLKTRKSTTIERGHVVGPLFPRLCVEAQPDSIRFSGNRLRVGLSAGQSGHHRPVFAGEHPPLGERELVNGIGRYPVPIDEVVH
jgi:hypothetical protein